MKLYQPMPYGVRWTLQSGGFHFPPRLSAATTYGHTTIFRPGLVPSAPTLAHEFYHVMTTNWVRYAFSYTVGRLWADKYWLHQEMHAAIYASLHAVDPLFLALSGDLKRLLPAGWPLVDITNRAT